MIQNSVSAGKQPVKPNGAPVNTKEPTAEDKLKVRDQQIVLYSLAVQRANLEVALMQAKAIETRLLAELSEKTGCEIDPQTLMPKTPAA
jgi:hypothetical protein